MKIQTIDSAYTDLIKDIFNNGTIYNGRNGSTRALIDRFPQLHWNLLTQCFPIIACRKQNIDHYINEFLWELNGGDNTMGLNKFYAPVDSRFLWDNWADEEGYIEYSYGACWRDNTSAGIDQLRNIVEELRTNPLSRRLTLVTQDVEKNNAMFFDVFDVPQVSPCHPCIQFSSDGVYLNAHIFSRSQDAVVGLPGDMIRYSLLTMVLAKLSGLTAKNVCISFTNVHYYVKDEWKILKILDLPIDEANKPELTLVGFWDKKQLKDFTYSDFNLSNYVPNKFVSFPLTP